MKHKIYIASSLKNCDKVLEMRDKLEKYNIELTYDWAEFYKASNGQESRDEWQEIACMDYIGVLDAAALLFICPAGRGSHFELGVAYAKNIPIILIEGDDPIAFYEMPDIMKVKDEEEAIKKIVEIVNAKDKRRLHGQQRVESSLRLDDSGGR